MIIIYFVTVKLTGGDLAEAKTTKTDANGNYKFEGLKNGEYKVTFETPEGYEITKTNEGTDDEKDSDGKEVTVTIKDADNMSVDLGLVKKEKTYTLGDKVWIDDNKDGIQTDGEKGVEGVTVKLTGGDLAEAKTTKTDANGNYKFEGLKNGEYKVTFETPEGYEITKTSEGTDDEKDSDGKEVTVTIKDADNMSVDLGLVKKETPGKPSEPTTPTPSKPNDDKPVVPTNPIDPEEPTPIIPAEPIEEEPGKVIENEDKPVVETEEKDNTVEDKDEEKTVENTEETPEKVENSVKESIIVPRQKISSNPKTGVASSLGVMGTLAASALAFLGLDDKKRKNK